MPGVGDKTAVKLLQEYGTLELILKNAGEIKGKLGEKLVTFADQARFSKELATIRRDAPVEFTLSSCTVPDFTRGIPFLKKLRLNSIIRRITEGGDPQNGDAVRKPAPEPVSFEPIG